jgi:hypothetical protein
LPPAALNQTCAFQLPSCIRDGWPLNTQHFCEQVTHGMRSRTTSSGVWITSASPNSFTWATASAASRCRRLLGGSFLMRNSDANCRKGQREGPCRRLPWGAARPCPMQLLVSCGRTPYILGSALFARASGPRPVASGTSPKKSITIREVRIAETPE